VTTWIATAFEMTGVHDAVIVEAETEEAAAEEGMEALQAQEYDKGGNETLDRVFVAPFDPPGRIAYVRRIAVELAELQCCGGPAPSWVGCGGHFATCDQRPPETGQPREEEPPDG
jgi:hypothetical protein